MDAAAPFGVASDVVLRELISLAVAHSKSAVPAALLADVTALKKLMRHIILMDLDRHRGAEAMPAPEDALTDAPGANARWYSDPIRDPYAWLDSPHAAHRALVDDAIDAVRLVRAADALRQRGTTLRTSAGYEIFIDADSGSAVFALRTEANDRLFLRACRESGQCRRGQPPPRVRDSARQPARGSPPRALQLAGGGRGGLCGDRVCGGRRRRRRARSVRLPPPVARSG